MNAITRARPTLIAGSSLVPAAPREVVRAKRQYRNASPYIEQQLAKIKSEYGAKLICHPDYVPNPRHSNNPEIYVPARAAFVASIAAAAQRDRERNPAYILANKIRNIVGEKA